MTRTHLAPLLALLLLAPLAAVPAPAQDLGTTTFPNSGAAEAQEPFLRGILLLHSEHLEGVDLDADCVLYGQPEYIFWLPPATWSEFWHWGTFAPGPGGPPRQLITLHRQRPGT